MVGQTERFRVVFESGGEVKVAVVIAGDVDGARVDAEL